MAYESNVTVELMIPRRPGIAERLHGFYGSIGWLALDDRDQPFDTYVQPGLGYEDEPRISYWQTEALHKVVQFKHNGVAVPSKYSLGLRLPVMQELVEVCLTVRSADDVDEIFERGGMLLRSHAHIPPREHAGRREFRYKDPFNYSFRVVAKKLPK